MSESNERTWNWKQADGSILKVVSNHVKGTIIVYSNERVVLKDKNLSSSQIKLLEENFLNIVAK